MSVNARAPTLFSWLEQRPSWREYWKIVGAAFALDLVWTIYVMSCLVFIVGLSSRGTGDYQLMHIFTTLPLWHAGLVLASGTLIEEVIFRFVPLCAAILLWRMDAVSKPFIIVVAVLASVVFGLAHGLAITTLFLQGVSGFIYCIVFLKVSGMRMRYVLYALLTVWMSHLAWNIVAIGSMYVV